MKKKMQIAGKLSKYHRVPMGVFVGFAALLLSGAVLAIFIKNEYLEITDVGYYIFLVQLVASGTGALVAGAGAGENAIILCSISTAVIFVLQLFLGIMSFNGVSMTAIWGVLGCLCGLFVAVVLCKKTNKGVVGTRKRAGYR